MHTTVFVASGFPLGTDHCWSMESLGFGLGRCLLLLVSLSGNGGLSGRAQIDAYIVSFFHSLLSGWLLLDGASSRPCVTSLGGSGRGRHSLDDCALRLCVTSSYISWIITPPAEVLAILCWTPGSPCHTQRFLGKRNIPSVSCLVFAAAHLFSASRRTLFACCCCYCRRG